MKRLPECSGSPCFVMADGVKKVKNGGLNNIAPSVLKIMGLEIPAEMDEALI